MECPDRRSIRRQRTSTELSVDRKAQLADLGSLTRDQACPTAVEPCSPPLQPGGPELVSIFKTSLWLLKRGERGQGWSNRRWALSAPALSEEGAGRPGRKAELESAQAGGWL